MFDFLVQNIGTIMIGAVLLAAIVLVIVKLYRDKKHGKSSCSCGCKNCPSHSICHKP
jgi:hypothetical protein